MPCHSDYPTENFEAQNLRRMLSEREAMLCGILTVLEGSVGVYSHGELYNMVLSRFDTDEAGVDRKAIGDWFKHHKAEDEARRERERNARKRQRERDLRDFKRLADKLGYEVE